MFQIKNIKNMGDKQSKVSVSTLTEEGIAHLMETTSFTREEILQWHEGFVVSKCFA